MWENQTTELFQYYCQHIKIIFYLKDRDRSNTQTWSFYLLAHLPIGPEAQNSVWVSQMVTALLPAERSMLPSEPWTLPSRCTLAQGWTWSRTQTSACRYGRQGSQRSKPPLQTTESIQDTAVCCGNEIWVLECLARIACHAFPYPKETRQGSQEILLALTYSFCYSYFRSFVITCKQPDRDNTIPHSSHST